MDLEATKVDIHRRGWSAIVMSWIEHVFAEVARICSQRGRFKINTRPQGPLLIILYDVTYLLFLQSTLEII